MARRRPFCTLSRFKLLQVGQGANLCRWPRVHFVLSLCHATQLTVHQGRSTPLPTMWYDHLVFRYYVFLLNAVSGWKPVRWPWS